mmetsp:Transcript_10764/g.26006  ORF Transcript_10764/g.26006 Transcript_10764/m.26006 type:complete len:137 (+) Transcript_10764:57-467(+)
MAPGDVALCTLEEFVMPMMTLADFLGVAAAVWRPRTCPTTCWRWLRCVHSKSSWRLGGDSDKTSETTDVVEGCSDEGSEFASTLMMCGASLASDSDDDLEIWMEEDHYLLNEVHLSACLRSSLEGHCVTRGFTTPR